MGASLSRKTVGALTGAVTGGCLTILVLGTSVVILLSRGIPPLMQTVMDAALSKGKEAVTVAAGGGVTGGAAAAAAAAGNVAAGVVLGAPFVGAVGGSIIGWEAAEDADSMNAAIRSAIDSNFELAKHVIENVHQFTDVALKAKKMTHKYKSK